MGEWRSDYKVAIAGTGVAVLTTLAQIFSEYMREHEYYACIAAIIAIIMIVIPLSHTFFVWLKRRVNAPEIGSPLEIIFEPFNPARRFWSLIGYLDDAGKGHSYWEHRVEIRNTSQKTVRNVMVTVERIGPCPQLPFSPPFKRSQLEKCDINPGCSELIQVNTWPHPKVQVGMLAGRSAWGYGPIQVIASGDDVLPAERKFAFNYETEQMLFDEEVY
jgi:hypothetical protein